MAGAVSGHGWRRETPSEFVDFDVPGIIDHGESTGRKRRVRRTQSGDLGRLRRHKGELRLDLAARVDRRNIGDAKQETDSERESKRGTYGFLTLRRS